MLRRISLAVGMVTLAFASAGGAGCGDDPGVDNTGASGAAGPTSTSGPGATTSTGGGGAPVTTSGSATSPASSGTSTGDTSAGSGGSGGAPDTTTSGTGGDMSSSTGGGGDPTAAELLAKLGSCGAPVTPPGLNCLKATNNDQCADPGGKATIPICKQSAVLWWKADMDVDCDGAYASNSVCALDTSGGQSQTSIQGDPPGGDVDPSSLPYFVIPLGKPESTWYTGYDIDLGQVGAVIYKDKVVYGVFVDQAGGNFIGEASYAMCTLFIGDANTGKMDGSDPCDPNTGGIDAADFTYITFSGAQNRVSTTDNAIFDHNKHTQMGVAAAKAWLAGP